MAQEKGAKDHKKRATVHEKRGWEFVSEIQKP